MTGIPYFYPGIKASKRVEDTFTNQYISHGQKIFSVIIPSYGFDPNILKIVEIVLLESELLQEIIIVFDGKKKPLANELIKLPNEYINVFYTDSHCGASIARNIGINNSTGKILLFLDSDCVPQEGILKNHLKNYLIQDSNRIVAVGGITEFTTTSYVDKLIKQSMLLFSFEASKKYNYLLWSPTVNLSVESILAKKILFNTDFPRFGGGEDVLFGFLLNEYGKIKGSSDAIVYHPIWKRKSSLFRRFIRWGYADGVLMNKLLTNTLSVDRYILREPTLLTLFLISSLIILPICVYKSNFELLFIPIFSFLITFSSLVIFEITNGKSFLVSVVDQLFCLLFDFGSTLGRLKFLRSKVIFYRPIHFEDQFEHIWKNTLITIISFILGSYIALIWI